MMLRAALLIALMVPSIAIARPSVYAGPKVSLTDRGHARWMVLTEPTRIDGGRELIDVGAQAGRFTAIRLFNNRGSSRIDQVVIELVGGGTQTVRVGRELTSSSPMTVPLNGSCEIARIIVFGSTSAGAAYQVLAL